MPHPTFFLFSCFLFFIVLLILYYIFFLEDLTHFTVVSLIGGIKHPIICSISGILFCIGSILYQVGYSDLKLKVETARYEKGGVLKWIGYFAALGSSISMAGTIQKWW